jgi:hypothetical protein
MNCKNTKSLNGQSPKIRWDITVDTGKVKRCSNNCHDCPNKQPSSAINDISQVVK